MWALTIWQYIELWDFVEDDFWKRWWFGNFDGDGVLI